MEHGRRTVLLEGSTCWRVTYAARASLLVDAAGYYLALRAALLQARHQVLIAGWEVDSRTDLVPDPARPEHSDGAPVQLGELLGYLVQRRPGLRVHVSCWDHHVLYAKGREQDTARRLYSLAGERLQFCADDCHAVAGSVHHKLVVIDDAVAFCGGVDLTQRRWDTSTHAPADELRCDRDGKPYQAMHDAQILVAGGTAVALGDYLRERWRALRGVQVSAPPPAADATAAWPPDVHVDFENVAVGIARTLPAHKGLAAVREIEALYEHAIRTSQRELYFENQYYTSRRIAQALAQTLREQSELQGLLAAPAVPRTWTEQYAMGDGRVRFYEQLRAAGVIERLPLVSPCDAAGRPIVVHSKLAVFDDRVLLVGSANLNNRSMGFDAECNLAIEARSAEHRAQIRRLRNRLLGEHLGRTAQEVEAALQTCALARLPERLADRPRKLLPTKPTAWVSATRLAPVLRPLFDPTDGWFDTARRTGAMRRAMAWSGVVFLVAATALTLALVGDSMLSDSQAARLALQHWKEFF